MKSTTIALDLASTTIEVAVSNHPGHVHERHRLSRKRVLSFFREREPAKVLMEACGSAHYWAREIRALGHEVQLLPPHAVRPYVTRNKTDRADAKGILEAFRNEEILPVPIKSPDQQALAAIHRLRSAWITTRTARLNALRGCLREFGILIPLGARKVAPHVRLVLEDAQTPIPELLRPLLAQTLDELEEIERRIHLAERISCRSRRPTPTWNARAPSPESVR
ncbi:MAG: IS110 family transposase [bacterium]